jgi:hypothetical protein
MTVAPERRGPKSMAWYEEQMKNALRNYGRSHVLARNKLCQLSMIRALADEQPPDVWDPEVKVLRRAIQWCVNRVIELADDSDKKFLAAVLRGVLRDDKMEAIGIQLDRRRETIQRVWWPQALRATTIVFMRRYGRAEGNDSASRE